MRIIHFVLSVFHSVEKSLKMSHFSLLKKIFILLVVRLMEKMVKIAPREYSSFNLKNGDFSE